MFNKVCVSDFSFSTKYQIVVIWVANMSFVDINKGRCHTERRNKLPAAHARDVFFFLLYFHMYSSSICVWARTETWQLFELDAPMFFTCILKAKKEFLVHLMSPCFLPFNYRSRILCWLSLLPSQYFWHVGVEPVRKTTQSSFDTSDEDHSSGRFSRP